MTALKIGVIGAGIGGLAAAIALERAGHEVTVYEQAKQFFRVGADINLTPNAVRAIDGLGIGEGVRQFAARVEQSGETVFFYTQDARPLLDALAAWPQLRTLHRPANLEDLFLKLTGRQIREDG